MVGDVLYTSGQIALYPITGNLIEGGVEEETKQVMKNLEAVLEAAGDPLKMCLKQQFS